MRLLSALLLGLLLVACGGDADDHAGHDHEEAPTVLKFTAIPNQNTTELQRKYEPVAKYLTEALGMTVEYVPSGNYEASVNMFENGTVHMAWFGGLTGVRARDRVKGAKAIAMGAEDPQYKSYFIAHKDSGLAAGPDFPAAIADKKFTFGSSGSTSGRLMPEFFIMKNSGKSAQDFFKNTPNFSGSHDKTVDLVDSGQFPCGVLDYKVFEKRRDRGETKNCSIIWTTPHYADYNITAHPALGEELMKKLQDAMVAMPAALAQSAFGRSSIIAAKNADFVGIKDVAIKLDLLKAK